MPLEPGWSVRQAHAGDFAAVTALLELLGRAEVTAETADACRILFAEQIADPECCHLIAEDPRGDALGFCSLHFRGRLNHPAPQAWIPDLVVAERARRHGVATALMEEAERRARERGCWSLTLESGYDRAEAHLLYEALGMTDLGKYFGKRL